MLINSTLRIIADETGSREGTPRHEEQPYLGRSQASSPFLDAWQQPARISSVAAGWKPEGPLRSVPALPSSDTRAVLRQSGLAPSWNTARRKGFESRDANSDPPKRKRRLSRKSVTFIDGLGVLGFHVRTTSSTHDKRRFRSWATRTPYAQRKVPQSWRTSTTASSASSCTMPNGASSDRSKRRSSPTTSRLDSGTSSTSSSARASSRKRSSPKSRARSKPLSRGTSTRSNARA